MLITVAPGLKLVFGKLYVDMSFAIVTDGRGAALGSVAMARDATERYLAELAARKASGV